MNRNLTRFGSEGKTLHANDVAKVKTLFKNKIKKRFILTRTNLITFQVDLNFAHAILQHHKSSLAHVADHHNATRKRYILQRIRRAVKRIQDMPRRSIHLPQV